MNTAASAMPLPRNQRTKEGVLHFLTREQMAEEIIRLDAALLKAAPAEAGFRNCINNTENFPCRTWCRKPECRSDADAAPDAVKP